MLTIERMTADKETLEELLTIFECESNESCISATETAIALIDKAIPIKPVRVTMGQSKSTSDGCPMCQQCFMSVELFCSFCGQAINWEGIT